MQETRVFRNFIGGAFVDSADGRTQSVIDPATEEVHGHVAVSGRSDVDAAMKAARSAFADWSRRTPAQRQRALLGIADDIERNADELLRIECANTGKPTAVAHAEELPMILEQTRFFAGAARVLEGRAAAEYLPGLTSWVRREPVGVCAQITPWNYPILMAVWKFAPALAAGNAVVLKPAETTPASTLYLAELMAEHLPAGVFNVVCGGRDAGAALAAHSEPDMVSVTGSVRAGKNVAEAAVDDVKRVHLELGGKAPVVVFDDADVQRAAQGIAEAAFFNAGQDCTAATRVLAGPEVHDALVEALTERARATETGPQAAEPFYGPLNNADQLAHVRGVVDRLPEHATVHTGGCRVGERGYFYAPTVVSGLEQGDEAVQTEIFGPVLTVQRFNTEDEAVAMANGVEYGLASSVWTADHGRALRMSRDLDFGCVWINTHIPLVGEMPHGGFKHSGHGKDLSMYGLEDYTRVKHVMSQIED